MVAGLSAQDEGFYDADLYRIVIEVKDAIVRQDTEYLMRYVSPGGTSFIDNHYTYDEIDEAMKDKDSWLYKEHLDLAKFFFDGSTDLEIEMKHMGPAHGGVWVRYSSQERGWLECCFYKRNGKWYFAGIFSCD